MTRVGTFVLVATFSILGTAEAFKYRFYANGDCNHGDSADSTFPRNDQGPNSGDTGNCYSAPVGVNWQRLEIDTTFSGSNHNVITFCNVGCQGGGSPLQQGTNCFVPSSGCAIGSFKVT